VGLPDVRVRDNAYTWPNEDLLVTTVTRGGCKHCAFYEDRKLPFVPVSPMCFGTFDLYPNLGHHHEHYSKPNFEIAFTWVIGIGDWTMVRKWLSVRPSFVLTVIITVYYDYVSIISIP
jgi:hypothetical protein